jgi:hypothetical protein
MKNPTRRQHHVWRHYIDAWATDRRVWCLINGRVNRTNTLNVGVEGDFYKLQKLTAEDRDLLQGLIEKSHEPARPMLEGFLHMFDGWYELRDSVPSNLHGSKEIKKAFDEFILTAEENFHGQVEAEFVPTLAKLRDGDANALNDDEAAMDFCYFVALQWTRTKATRKAVLGRTGNRPGFDASRILPIAAHITAANLGWTLFARREQNKLQLIENLTDIPLITGDQPVINLQGGSGGDSPPEYMSVYYPISPRYAVFIDDYRHPLNLDEAFTWPDSVHELNRRMAATANMQVYASTRECLIPYGLLRQP